MLLPPRKSSKHPSLGQRVSLQHLSTRIRAPPSLFPVTQEGISVYLMPMTVHKEKAESRVDTFRPDRHKEGRPGRATHCPVDPPACGSLPGFSLLRFVLPSQAGPLAGYFLRVSLWQRERPRGRLRGWRLVPQRKLEGSQLPLAAAFGGGAGCQVLHRALSRRPW